MATIGTVTAAPGIPTIINERCEVTLDQRAFTPEQLEDMLADVKAAADRIAEEEGVEVEWKRIWQIDPIPFDDELVELAAQAVRRGHRRRRGAAAAVRRAARLRRGRPPRARGDGLLVLAPTASATRRVEDTPEDDLRVALQAYGRLYELTAGMISRP